MTENQDTDSNRREAYMSRLPAPIADEVEDYRHDDDGNEIRNRSEAIRELVVDGLNADEPRPIMTWRQLIYGSAFFMVFFTTVLHPELLLIAVPVALLTVVTAEISRVVLTRLGFDLGSPTLSTGASDP